MTTDPIKPAAAVWTDSDPLMEAIASTVWEHCARDDKDMPQLVCDDPRTIAAWAAAVARAQQPAELARAQAEAHQYRTALQGTARAAAVSAGPAPATDRADLRDRIARAARTVQIRIGPITLGLVQRGEPIILSGSEADAVADAVLAVLPSCPDPIECSHEAALGEAQQQVRRLGLMVDEYGAGASALTGKLKQLRDIGHRLAAHAVGFQDVLDDSDRGPWARTVGADITELCTVLDAPDTGTPLGSHVCEGRTVCGSDCQPEPAVVAQPDEEA